MASNAIYTRQNETLVLAVNTDDETATTATLKVGNVGASPIVTQAASFNNGTATITCSAATMNIATGSYKYQINVDSPSGTDMFPDPTSKAQDLPQLVITESL